MPSQEIPAELRDSSPDTSIAGELPAARVEPAAPEPEPAPPYAAAQIHIRVQPPPPPPAVPPDDVAAIINQQRRPAMQRTFSYDRDIAEYEEDNYWPGRAYLLPVVLPQVTEPTLDELLRRVTGRTDLQHVDTVKLRVISYMVSLSRISLFMPRLAQLDLSGSVIHSLRDLGCGLVHLRHLNVSNCGLSSFDGTSGLPSVRELIADGNMVQLVGPLADLPLLKKLSARHNRIGDLGTLSFLGMCPNLVEVELEGNPVTNLILYRMTLERSVPTLELLDGEPILRGQAGSSINSRSAVGVIPQARQSYTDNGDSSTELESVASSTPPSSLSSEIYSEASEGVTHVEIATFQEPRPSTTGGIEGGSPSGVTILRRPASGSVIIERATANTRNTLSNLQLAGSVLDIARRRKRHAWGDSSSSSLSSSSASSAATSPAITRQTTPNSGTGGSNNGSGIRIFERPLRRHRTQLPPLGLDASQTSLSSLEENASN